MWKYHRCYGFINKSRLSHRETIKVKMFSSSLVFISKMEHYMAARRYEISLLVLKKYFTRSLRSLVKYFSTLEEKFRISVRPCNILYVLAVFPVSFLFAYSTMLTHINASFANHSFDCIIGKFVGGNFWTLRCLACWKVVIRINTGLW